MAEKTGKGEGFGKVLALGGKRLCEKYGHPELLHGRQGPGVRGLRLPRAAGHGPGLRHQSNRGACHLKHDVFAEDMEDVSGNGKAEPVKKSQDVVAMIDSTGLCLFTTAAWGPEDFAAQIDAACEGDWPLERIIESGERTFNLERMFNLGAGLTKADDTLPKRLLETPAPSGNAKGKVNELDKMLPEYYQFRGWTEDGVPSNETLSRLGL